MISGFCAQQGFSERSGIVRRCMDTAVGKGRVSFCAPGLGFAGTKYSSRSGFSSQQAESSTACVMQRPSTCGAGPRNGTNQHLRVSPRESPRQSHGARCPAWSAHMAYVVSSRTGQEGARRRASRCPDQPPAAVRSFTRKRSGPYRPSRRTTNPADSYGASTCTGHD